VGDARRDQIMGDLKSVQPIWMSELRVFLSERYIKKDSRINLTVREEERDVYQNSE
jgi:hypothetical protein